MVSLFEIWHYKPKINIIDPNWNFFIWCVTFVDFKSYGVIILKVTPSIIFVIVVEIF